MLEAAIWSTEGAGSAPGRLALGGVLLSLYRGTSLPCAQATWPTQWGLAQRHVFPMDTFFSLQEAHGAHSVGFLSLPCRVRQGLWVGGNHCQSAL